MQDHHASSYVAQTITPQTPAPRSEVSVWGRLQKNLFGTPFESAITIALAIFTIWAGWKLLNWTVFTAVFTGTGRDACLPVDGNEVGACWAFVNAKAGQLFYGLFPVVERWRVDLVMLLLVVLTVPIAIPSLPAKRLNAILLFAVYPFVTLILLTGGHFSLGGGWVGFLFILAAFVAVVVAGSRMGANERLLRVATWLAIAAIIVLFIGNFIASDVMQILSFSFTALSLVATLLAFGSIVVSIVASAAGQKRRTLAVPIIVLIVIAALVADFGLTSVPTHLWGGLSLTLVVALIGIGASLPIGILLALGRRSHLPAVRLCSIIFIEFWRGVPLITVLFMSAFMIPLLLPDGVTFNNLLRALIGVSLYAAAYMAEVIRGGLQAIPRGQYEGAQALGLGYWPMMRLIIMPQALKLVIPGIVNAFISLFKDTSLVSIIGLADLLGTVRRGFSDPSWITPTTAATGLVFAAIIYWVFCFGMSRYSIFMERRLETGHRN